MKIQSVIRSGSPNHAAAARRTRMLTIAEDLEYFRTWWEKHELVSNVTLRHASCALRRLLVENVALALWKQLGFQKSPKIQGPDLLAFCNFAHVNPSLAHAIAGGIRVANSDYALIGAFRKDNPKTGIPASAESGFAVSFGVVHRDAGKPSTFGELDKLVDRMWHLPDYMKAPGLIRRGQKLSRQEVIQHVANEMGGVHLFQKRKSPKYELLVEAERTLFIDTTSGEIRGPYIELLAIGQAVGQSEDLQKLAKEIRTRFE